MKPKLQRWAMRWFGSWTSRSARHFSRLAGRLQRAHIPMRVEAYLALGILGTLLAFTAGLLVPAAAAVAYFLGWASPTVLFASALAPVAAAAVTAITLSIYPIARAARRGNSIAATLPFALNYVATTAGAGATPTDLFRGLAKQNLYGGVATEAAWIVRDLELMGDDLVTALARAMERTPSPRFQDLLQGIITILTSGGDLAHYFDAKREQFMFENRQNQRKFIDSLGVLAESFVVVAVAAPLFLLVMMSVMTLFGARGTQMLAFGYATIIGLLPMVHAAFAVTVRTITPEA